MTGFLTHTACQRANVLQKQTTESRLRERNARLEALRVNFHDTAARKPSSATVHDNGGITARHGRRTSSALTSRVIAAGNTGRVARTDRRSTRAAIDGRDRGDSAHDSTA